MAKNNSLDLSGIDLSGLEKETEESSLDLSGIDLSGLEDQETVKKKDQEEVSSEELPQEETPQMEVQEDMESVSEDGSSDSQSEETDVPLEFPKQRTMENQHEIMPRSQL